MIKITKRKETKVSKYLSLMEKTLSAPFYKKPQIFHSIKPKDYVSVFAITKDGKIPLVRQFRNAAERYTLELPSGLLEKGDCPECKAAGELYEETGYVANDDVIDLGILLPDSGRMDNQLHCFFAEYVTLDKNWEPENGVEKIVLTKKEFKSSILSGEFNHAMNLAVVQLAVLYGLFRF